MASSRESRGYIYVTKEINNKNKMLARYKRAIKERKNDDENDQVLSAYTSKGSFDS